MYLQGTFNQNQTFCVLLYFLFTEIIEGKLYINFLIKVKVNPWLLFCWFLMCDKCFTLVFRFFENYFATTAFKNDLNHCETVYTRMYKWIGMFEYNKFYVVWEIKCYLDFTKLYLFIGL